MRRVAETMSYRFSRGGLLLLAFIVAGVSTAVLFFPYLHSILTWSSQRTLAFEGKTVSLPRRWISGEQGHLFSIRKPPVTLLFPYESSVVVDPFANRWPADKLANARDLWLRAHGVSAVAKFKKELNGSSAGFGTGTNCVSPSPQQAREYVRIYCLSADASLSLEFFGERDAVAEFGEISSQIVADSSAKR